jgi:hypothetical protein
LADYNQKKSSMVIIFTGSMLGKTEDTYKKLDRISVLFLITANIDAGPDFTNVLLDYRGD